jgi:flagellar protein FlaJ
MEDVFLKIRENIQKQKELARNIKTTYEGPEAEKLIKTVKVLNSSIPEMIEDIPEFSISDYPKENLKEKGFEEDVQKPKEEKDDKFEQQKKEIAKKVLKRLRENKKETVKVKERKPSNYVKLANSFFSEISLKLSKGKSFQPIKQDLIHANISLLPVSYISITLLTTVLSFIFSFLIFLFLMFFNINIQTPFITLFNGDYLTRFVKVSWIFIVIPVITFLVMYLYPSTEKSSIQRKINQELPFVTIHMSAISGSMVEPSKIFSIIISTKEYPAISKEFTKVINEINIYGYDLVSALRKSSANTSSEKLSDLYNGLATTITSGGNLQRFFEKRAQSLLFDYRLEREKFTRTAETFMDIYISVVIAAPMILMLLLMMIKITGLGISLSTSLLTLIIILTVVVINIVFLTVLQLKQPEA